MELTKLEMAIVIGSFIESLGTEGFENCADEHTLKRLDEEAEKINYNSSPKQMYEAGISVVNKIIQGILEEQSPPLKNKNQSL